MPKDITVGWVHINTDLYMTRTRPDKYRLFWGSMAPQETDGESDHWEALPYASGLLQAYAQHHAPNPERYQFLPPIYSRLPVEHAAACLSGANVVGFSVYLWNVQLSLAIAKRLKEQQPDTLIVLGGPQVPTHAEAFLSQHPYVDLVCHGEGERTFLSILEDCETRTWAEDIPSISYLRRDGTCANHAVIPPVEDLSLIPSPYLAGVFDPLIQANPHEKWMALWETNRGCPYTCAFCSWHDRRSVASFARERLKQEIDWLVAHQIEYIHCCDANFGILPQDLELAQYMVQQKKQHHYPTFFFVENDGCFSERAFQIHTALHEVALNGTVVVAVQSMNPQALRKARRRTRIIKLFESAQQRFTQAGIKTLIEMILALPGETYDSFAAGVSQVIEWGGHYGISCYSCAVLPRAEMAEPDYQTKHGMRIVRQELVAMHSALEDHPSRIPEFANTVVATETMPAQDWVKAKTFFWMVELLYFDQVFRIPLVLLNQLHAIPYRDLFEAVAQADLVRYPVLAEIRDMLEQKGNDIQNGGVEYFPSEAWMNMWWPADQYVLIKLTAENKLGQFYRECEHAIGDVMHMRGIAFDPALLHQAVELNQSLLIRPFCLSNETLELPHNILEFYQSVMQGAPVALEEKLSEHRILRTRPIWLTWDDWFEYLIFCHHNRNYYWYRTKSTHLQNEA